MTVLMIMCLAFIQNVSFTMVSRARNRDNWMYHTVCSVLSNGLWFLTMHHLVTEGLDYWLAIPYILGTVLGSNTGAVISMRIERLIGAKT